MTHQNGSRNGGKGGLRHVPDEPTLPAVRTLPKSAELEREFAAAIILGEDRGTAIALNIREQALQPTRGAQWAMLAADIVGWRGTKEQVIAYIVAQLGCSVDEARAAHQQIERVPQDPHEIYAICKPFVQWYESQHPGGKA